MPPYAFFAERSRRSPAERLIAELPVTVGGERPGFGRLVRARRDAPVPKPSRRHDVVVIGAGLSGLAAAHTLSGCDVLVLEKEDRPGGHARRDAWNGVIYAEGTSYITEPDDALAALLSELSVPLVPIPEPGDAYHVGGRLVTDFWGAGSARLPFSHAARRAFCQFRADLAALSDLPTLPVEAASARALGYDRFSLAEAIRGYGPEVGRYMDLFCRAALGGPASEVSAYWGLSFYGDEFAKRYSAPGGMAELGAALLAAIGPERLVTDAVVTRVAPAGDGAWVTYESGGERITVAARAVVMAASKHVARQVVVGLPAEQRRAMARMRYEPYVVVNVLVNGAVSREAFDVWVDDQSFVDVTVADWVAPTGGSSSVLTAYCPLSESERYRLLSEHELTGLARSVVLGLEEMYPGLAARVAGLRAYRRTHGLVLSAVGALSELRPHVVRPCGPVLFANTDNQMTGAAEAAIFEGQRAAQAALARLVRPDTA